MLDKNDETKIEKVMVKVVGNALEQIVLPRLQKIEDMQEEQGKKLTELTDDSGYLKDQVTRIDLKLDSEVKRHDEHGAKIEKLSTRVLKLEIKKV